MTDDPEGDHQTHDWNIQEICKMVFYYRHINLKSCESFWCHLIKKNVPGRTDISVMLVHRDWHKIDMKEEWDE